VKLLQQEKDSKSTNDDINKAESKEKYSKSEAGSIKSAIETTGPQQKTNKTELNNPITSKITKLKRAMESDLVERINCPVCPFTLDLSLGKSQSDARHNMRTKRKMIYHYMNVHNPVQIKDVSVDPEGQEYYKCPSCPFAKFIKPKVEGEKRSYCAKKYDALLCYARHHLSLHSSDTTVRNRGFNLLSMNPPPPRNDDNNATSSTPSSSEPKNRMPQKSITSGRRNSIKLLKTPDLIDGKYYFTCPFPNCEFCYSSDFAETDCPTILNRKLRYGLQKLGNHFIRHHSSEQTTEVSKDIHSNNTNDNDPYYAPYMAIDNGLCKLKCPRTGTCNFSVPVEESEKGRTSAYNIFSKHYAIHVYNDSSDPVNSKKLKKSIAKDPKLKKKPTLPGLKLAKSKYRIKANKPLPKDTSVVMKGAKMLKRRCPKRPIQTKPDVTTSLTQNNATSSLKSFQPPKFNSPQPHPFLKSIDSVNFV